MPATPAALGFTGIPVTLTLSGAPTYQPHVVALNRGGWRGTWRGSHGGVR